MKINLLTITTKTALTTVENKMPDVNNLVKKADYNTKNTKIENKLTNHNHDKYIDTEEFNKLAADVFNGRLAQAKLITKMEVDAKLPSLNRKITSNKTKHLLMDILVMELDLIEEEVFHFQVADLVKMY